MNIKITGKDLKATDSIKEYVEKKCERLQKYTEEELEVKATIKTEGKKQVAELSTNINGNIYRAVTEKEDLYASIDKDIDIIEGQIRKTKAKKEKQMTSGSIKAQEFISFNEESHQVEQEVLKTTYYEVRPMSVEDAKMKLQDSNNMFLTFVNAETEKVNVIFKLKDGINFGLVEPE
ncbi:MAG: ribosome-associated translation inhibitor RaiA [Clostridia bacterium]|nr:ribosome-associated translation inhibitor RaiA [Clostridia bacterium]